MTIPSRPIRAFALLALCAGLRAGTLVDSDFSGYSGTPTLAVDDSLKLPVLRYQYVRLYGDSILQTVDEGHSPAVISFGADSFTFFWGEPRSGEEDDRVIRRDLALSLDSFNLAALRGVDSSGRSAARYIDADQNNGTYLVTYVTNNSAGERIGANDIYSHDITKSQGSAIGSQCHLAADTFLVTHRVPDFTGKFYVVLKKIQSSLGGIAISDTDTVAVGSANAADPSYLTNSAVAADENGRILVLWTSGAAGGTKMLEYMVLDQDLNHLTSDTLMRSIASSSNYFTVDDAAAVSYAPDSFAVVTWDDNGLVYFRLVWDGGSMTVDSTRIVDRAGCQFPAIAVNDSLMIVAWKGDVLRPGTVGVEALKLWMASGEPRDSIMDTLLLSDASSEVIPYHTTRFGAEVDVALDVGSGLAAAWGSGDSAYAAAWANRAVTAPAGEWVSKVETLTVAEGDSVWFDTASIESRYESLDSIGDSIRVTTDPTDAGAWGPWVSLSDAAALELHAKGTAPYYQYKIHLYRQAADSLLSPVIDQVALRWNVQPGIDALDSVLVNGNRIASMRFDTTLTVFSRRDGIQCFLRFHDSDPGDQLTLTSSWIDSSDSAFSGAGSYTAAITFEPYSVSDTITTCQFSIGDQNGWEGVSQSFAVRTRNDPPHLEATATTDTAQGGGYVPISLGVLNAFTIQEEDSIVFDYSFADTNDADSCARVYMIEDGDTTVIDSVCHGEDGSYVVRGSTAGSAGFSILEFLAEDPDTQILKKVIFRANHTPVIDSILVAGQTLSDSDSVRVRLGDTMRVAVMVSDTDVTTWDTLTCRATYGNEAGSVRDAGDSLVLDFVPSITDTSITFVVYDLFNMADTLTLFYRFPWLTLDSTSNPALHAARDSLQTALSLIVGGGWTDTVAMPLLNTGNDSMSLTALRFTGQPNWLELGIREGDSVGVYPGGDLLSLGPITLAVDTAESLFVYVNADSLQGDGMVYDTLLMETSDPVHPIDTVPIRLEYNELPKVLSLSVSFERDRPYWLGKRKRGHQEGQYTFPPHARLRAEFSEPMDSASALDGIVVYSIYDSAAAGEAAPIPLRYSWSRGYTRVEMSPAYTDTSPAFNLLPPHGLFVPTDSLVVALSPLLTDTAATPSGPNGLDVDVDFVRDTTEDTSFALRVDSITFTVESIEPDSGATDVAPTAPIVIYFSGLLYGDSLGPALINDSSLVVSSRYNGGEPIPFDSVVVGADRAMFYLSRRLYAEDSVWCHYRGFAGRDTLGYPVDVSGDGIAAALFDSSSAEDDIRWFFKVRPTEVVSVSPDSGSVGNESRTTISLTFSDPILQGTFDFDSLTGNRSLRVRSTFGGNQQIAFGSLQISSDSTTVTVVPVRRFFSNDTVTCRFVGFSRGFRYDRISNLPLDTSNTMSGYTWSYVTRRDGFYTYPNPYKPGLDSRHCSGGVSGSPCGIWFKNLHVLKKNNKDVRVVVYNVNTHPVFDTRRAGIDIHFEPNDPERKPEWKWDTRNRKGRLVSSGVYFYGIYDLDNEVLMKGKLMIVR